MTFSTPPFYHQMNGMNLCEVNGPDSEDFLQRLLTNDLKAMSVNEIQLTSWCNIKGRVSALFRIIKLSNGFILVITDFNFNQVVQDLNKYLFNSKVSINNITDEYHIFVSHGMKIKNKSNLVFQENSLTWELKEVEGDPMTKSNRNEALNAKNLISLHQINNLVPSLTEKLCDKFLPQEINLENLGGLSFSKGCFPGQEIIARVKYRGKVKKRLVKLISKSPDSSKRLFTRITNEKGEPMGIIIDTAKDDRGFRHILAILSDINCNELFLDEELSIVPNE